MRQRGYEPGVLLALFVVLVVLFVVLPVLGMALWAFLTTILVGLIIGALARLIVPGRQMMGLLGTIVCGLMGSIVGGFIGQHVLHRGGLVTILLEIGVAAVAVALIGGAGRNRMSLR